VHGPCELGDLGLALRLAASNSSHPRQTVVMSRRRRRQLKVRNGQLSTRLADGLGRDVADGLTDGDQVLAARERP